MSRPGGIFKYQTFRLSAPAAKSVLLVGSFNRWQPVTMRSNEDGTWTTSLELPAGTYHYRYIVDGHWQDDPECPLRVPNPRGPQNIPMPR